MPNITYTEQDILNRSFDPALGGIKTTPTAESLITGSKTSTDTNATQLTATSTPCKGVYLKAKETNASVVYVGLSTVTADSVPATDGFPLYAGEGVFITVDNPNKVYFIGASGLEVFFMVTY